MENSLEALSKYRYEAGLEALEDARLMFANKRYKNALNRGYYAIFHFIRAVNSLDRFDSSKHSGVISFFNQHYVKQGIFPKEVSKLIKLASENREKADYLAPAQLLMNNIFSNSSILIFIFTFIFFTQFFQFLERL